MNEILALKQELLEGNFTQALRLTTELETMARQDKINALENFLALLVSRLIVIQVYENAVSYAIFIAVETTELLDGTDVEQLKETIDYELLRADTLKLIRLTYSLNTYEIDRYLQSLWSDRQTYLY